MNVRICMQHIQVLFVIFKTDGVFSLKQKETYLIGCGTMQLCNHGIGWSLGLDLE